MMARGDGDGWKKRPLDENEIQAIREMLDEWQSVQKDLTELHSMMEEWNRYKWAWGLVGRITAWAAGVIGAILFAREFLVKLAGAFWKAFTT